MNTVSEAFSLSISLISGFHLQGKVAPGLTENRGTGCLGCVAKRNIETFCCVCLSSFQINNLQRKDMLVLHGNQTRNETPRRRTENSSLLEVLNISQTSDFIYFKLIYLPFSSSSSHFQPQVYQ